MGSIKLKMTQRSYKLNTMLEKYLLLTLKLPFNDTQEEIKVQEVQT